MNGQTINLLAPEWYIVDFSQSTKDKCVICQSSNDKLQARIRMCGEYFYLKIANYPKDRLWSAIKEEKKFTGINEVITYINTININKPVEYGS